jgi:ubiquinone/menaquinone biosynthesis C-methylase UbiE
MTRPLSPRLTPLLFAALLLPSLAPTCAQTKAPPAPAEQKQPPQSAPTTQPVYEYRPGSRDGIDKWYMGRQIAHVMGHQAADWLERPEREQEENPTRLIEILKKRVKPTDVFADIGCGTGYYSFRLAPLVPQGKVIGVDIQQEMLDLLSAEAKKRNVTNVEPLLGTVEDPKLPAAGVDYALLVDAYHEFDHPREMMQAIYQSLKPGSGKVLLVEFRGEDPNVPIKPLHKMTEAQAKKEMAAVGLKHVETIEELPWQHVMIFERPKEKE